MHKIVVELSYSTIDFVGIHFFVFNYYKAVGTWEFYLCPRLNQLVREITPFNLVYLTQFVFAPLCFIR